MIFLPSPANPPMVSCLSHCFLFLCNGVPEEDVNHSSAPGSPTDHQNAVERLSVDRAPDDMSGQPLLRLRSAIPSDVSNASPSHHTGPVPVQHPLAPQPAPYPHTQPSRQYLNSERPSRPSGHDSPQQQRQSRDMFSHPRKFIASGYFINGDVGSATYNIFSSSQFMKDFLKETIPGAEFDSDARDPPPRCHPETRLAILDRCLHFIHNCDGKKKVRWVFGAAGVGKSAIMQNVVESPKLLVTSHASVFFSVNGRNDGKKAITTISFQFAAKCDLYRELIEHEINRDPSLLQSSMKKQFDKLIVEPFVHNPQLNAEGRLLVTIDGVDECRDSEVEKELLRLICKLCIEFPSSPLIWLIASRPEEHIATFFSKEEVAPAYEEEEIQVDSDEGRADVQRFLNDKLQEIKNASKSFNPRSKWPDTNDLRKLADAAGGLFAYADTVVRYIGDPNIARPDSQLSDVLDVIDKHPTTYMSREDHPMAPLDALYARILSNAPSKVSSRITLGTRKLLMALASGWDSVLQPSSPLHVPANFIVLCNWLGITPDEAHAAIRHLGSVLRIPPGVKHHKERLQPFHKSFIDYISDISRSGFSADIKRAAQQLKIQCASRILKEAPGGVDSGDIDYTFSYGIIRRGPNNGDTISLTSTVDEEPAQPVDEEEPARPVDEEPMRLVDEEMGWKDSETRLNLYKLAIGVVVAGMERGDPTFQSESYIRLLTSQFEKYGPSFPSFKLYELLFDESRRPGFKKNDILKEMPLKEFDISTVLNIIRLQFRRPATTETEFSDPWNSSCDHTPIDNSPEGDETAMDWTILFGRNGCASCFKRLKDQLENWKKQSPDLPLLISFTSTGDCCVECRFLDKNDGDSEWTYWFRCHLSLEERKRYGSTV